MITEEEKATISKFLRLTNGMRVKDVVEVVGEALEDDHRTNQQSFWRFIRELAGFYAGDATGHDLRNEGAREFAKQINLIEVHLPYV